MFAIVSRFRITPGGASTLPSKPAAAGRSSIPFTSRAPLPAVVTEFKAKPGPRIKSYEDPTKLIPFDEDMDSKSLAEF